MRSERLVNYSVYTIKNLGVRVGNELKVIAKQPFCLIVIEIDNREITREITKSPFSGLSSLPKHFFFFTKRKPVLKEKILIPFFRRRHRFLNSLGLIQISEFISVYFLFS